jgi:hypothetical protein
VVFGLEDSGSKNQVITYAAYPGEEPVFSSGVKITDWRKLTDPPKALPEVAKDKVWVSEVPQNKAGKWRFHALFDGSRSLGSNQFLPRAQSEGFRPVEDRGYYGSYIEMTFATRQQKSELYFPEDALIKDWPNLDDVEIKITPWGPFIVNFLPLKSVDTESNIAKTTVPATYPMRPIDWYADPTTPDDLPLETKASAWVENVLEVLDEPGEWVLNTHKGKLYLWPKGDTPSNNIIAPRLQELVRIEGKINEYGEDTPVRYLVFRGLTFAHGDRDLWQEGDVGVQHDWEVVDKPTALLRFRGSERCLVNQCRFINSGGTGLRFDLYCQHNTIQRNLFAYLGQVGILICGYGPGAKDVCHHNEIINNHLHHCGQLIWSSHGIIIWESGFNRIAHNLIHDMPRKAISLAGVRTHFFRPRFRNKYCRQFHKTIRWDEVGTGEGLERGYDYIVPFLHVRNNLVEYNHIYRIMTEGQDAGGINVTGAAEGNIIQRNCIHDITNMGADAAIRMDGNVRGTLVRENIIYNCTIPAINARDRNNYIENNIMVDVSSRRKIRQRGYFMFGPEGTGRFVRNVLYHSGKKRPFLLRLERAKLNQFKSDYNLFYSAGNPGISASFLRKLQKDGSDAHSISADPLFFDMDNDNFRLKPDSPMFERGFKQVDTGKIGLTEDFPQAWRD